MARRSTRTKHANDDTDGYDSSDSDHSSEQAPCSKRNKYLRPNVCRDIPTEELRQFTPCSPHCNDAILLPHTDVVIRHWAQRDKDELMGHQKDRKRAQKGLFHYNLGYILDSPFYVGLRIVGKENPVFDDLNKCNLIPNGYVLGIWGVLGI